MDSKKQHILMIDDDEDIRRLFGTKLALAGFEMIYASDGNEGREVARRMHPDLILLDINLGSTDGYTIARRLRQEPTTKDIPVIFLTNEDFTPEAEKAAKELWVVDYLHKSMDLDEVVEHVHKAMREHSREKSKKKPAKDK